MSEFNDRMQAQRCILALVNSRQSGKEELFGISAKAIDRWVTANVIDPSSRLVSLLRAVSGELVCLATKSQEQVSEEYRVLSSRVEELTASIRKEMG